MEYSTQSMHTNAACSAPDSAGRSHHAQSGTARLTGTSFKHAHLPAILDSGLGEGFFEVHAENYMGAGGPPHRMLAAIRRDYPVSVHGVCMSIGGPDALDERHLGRFRDVIHRYEPALVSEHLAWSSHNGTFFNDLLPLPYTRQTLDNVCSHIDQVQDAIQRSILLENPSTYVAFSSSTMSETQFLREVAQRTGCGLLLDINNVFVSATNHGFSASGYLADFPLERVGEIHLAGYSEQQDDENEPLLVDSHDRAVADPVWTLYADVISRIGPRATLIEWDSALPEWSVLRAQAWMARRIMEESAPLAWRLIMKSENAGSEFIAPFAAGLTNPLIRAPQDVAAASGKSNSKGVIRRYNVYRNNVTVSLIDALAAIYPAVQRITGVDFFRAMARCHLRETPPASPILSEYGRDFPGFIESWEHARNLPWLADTARIERAWLDAYHAADRNVLTAENLASVDPALLPRVRFKAHPATRIVRSPYPAVAIFAMNRTDGPVSPLCSSDAEDALITRPDHDVIVSRLPAGGARFLLGLVDGAPLADAIADAFEEAPAFDIHANLAGMISAGVFAAIELEHEDV